jgi:hypothetical protein
MSRRARRQANARPWEDPQALALGPEDEDDEPLHDEWAYQQEQDDETRGPMPQWG